MSVPPTPARRRFLLVTGMPRSGTTAVGSVLASSPWSAYFYEPLNPRSGVRTVTDYFVFPDGTSTSTSTDEVLGRVFGLDIRLRAGIWDADPPRRRLIKRVTGSRTRVSGLRCRLDPTRRTIVWKDPFASFLVPMLTSRFDLPTIITVRSPEASAASFKRLGWGFDVGRLSRQLRLLTPNATYLDQDFEDPDLGARPAVNGALLWRLLYGFLDASLPDEGVGLGARVAWANSRELIAQPLETYQRLFDAVGLDLGRPTQEYIAAEYRDEGSSEPDSSRAHDRHRNVTQVNAYWSRTLDENETEMIGDITGDVRAGLERRTGPL